MRTWLIRLNGAPIAEVDAPEGTDPVTAFRRWLGGDLTGDVAVRLVLPDGWEAAP